LVNKYNVGMSSKTFGKLIHWAVSKQVLVGRDDLVETMDKKGQKVKVVSWDFLTSLYNQAGNLDGIELQNMVAIRWEWVKLW